MVANHDVTPPRSTSAIKFLCSYGGKILPRYPDGKLRYHGGETRLLAVKNSVSFSELISKMGGLCATALSVSLRCQLPTEDLDALISITSDMDLQNLIEEYSHAISSAPSSGVQIRAFLSLPPSSSHATKLGFSPLFPKMVMRMPKQVGSPLMKSVMNSYGYRGGRIYLSTQFQQ